MAPSNEPIRLEQADLFAPHVEAYIEERAALKRACPEINPYPLTCRTRNSAWFYLGLPCAAAAIPAWPILGPFIDATPGRKFKTASLWLFPPSPPPTGFSWGPPK